MINLLPPETKAKRYYGHRNKSLINSIIFVVIGIAIISALFGVSYMSLSKTRESIENSIASKQSEIADLEKLNKEAQSISDTINTAGKLMSKQGVFVDIIKKIGSAMPSGASLSHLNLSIDALNKPFEIQAFITNENQASVLQKILVSSGVFEAADIQEVHTSKLKTDPNNPNSAEEQKTTVRILATLKKSTITTDKTDKSVLPGNFKP